MSDLPIKARSEFRRIVEDARLRAGLMRPSGYAATALKADAEYLRGVNNVADAVLNLIDPEAKQETAKP